MSLGVKKGQSAIPKTVFGRKGVLQGSGRVEYRWSRTGGLTFTEFHEGSEGEMVGRLELLRGAFDSATIRKVGDGEWYRLELAQADANAVDIHEVHGSNLTQSILVNPVWQSALLDGGLFVYDVQNPTFAKNSLTRLMSIINAAVLQFKQTNNADAYDNMIKRIVDDGGFGTQILANDTVSKAIKYACDKLIMGEDTFLNAQYVYHHTLSISERVWNANGLSYGGKPDGAGAFDNTNRVFTEDQMRNAEGIPTEFPLPKQIRAPDQPAMWLKQPSKPEFTWGQKRSISTEYLFADYWDSYKYYPARLA